MKQVLTACLLLASALCAGAVPVRFLAWDDAMATRQLGVVTGADKVDPISGLHPLQRSKEISYTPGEQGLVLRALDKKLPDGKPVDFKIPKAAGLSNALVILLPDSKSPAGVTGIAIDDNKTSFPWGSFRILNTTGKPLGMTFAKERKVLPGDWSPVDFKGADGPVQVALYTQDQPQRPSYAAVWAPEPEIRRLVFLAASTDDRLGPLAVKVIVEDRASETAPKQTAEAKP